MVTTILVQEATQKTVSVVVSKASPEPRNRAPLAASNKVLPIHQSDISLRWNVMVNMLTQRAIMIDRLDLNAR